MTSGSRRHFTPQQKARIVRPHLIGKEVVSDLAGEFQVQPSQIRGWVKKVATTALNTVCCVGASARLRQAAKMELMREAAKSRTCSKTEARHLYL